MGVSVFNVARVTVNDILRRRQRHHPRVRPAQRARNVTHRARDRSTAATPRASRDATTESNQNAPIASQTMRNPTTDHPCACDACAFCV
mmetsp:Transcript_1575/g.5040  ORF Transcript_1575/g.5040 Transcript_1575/m.5040 type:complete len:89 (+) Transcript_1575:1878-2144(+)